MATTMSLADQVYERIKQDILNGTLRAGDKIVEEDLVSQFNVSRTPVREAIRRLAEYGLVVIVPRSHVQVVAIDEKAAEDIGKLRMFLEFFAIDNITEESLASVLVDIAKASAQCQYALTIGDRAQCFEQDSLFHFAIIKAAGNKALEDVYARLDARVQLLRIRQNEPDNFLLHYIGQHQDILMAIKCGKKEEAKELLKAHIIHEKS